jgi:hypothetical protein
VGSSDEINQRKLSRKYIFNYFLFQIKKTKIVDVVVVIVRAKGVGGGEGGLESKGEGSWFQARDQSGWEFATMSKTSAFQVGGFFLFPT